MDRPRVLDLLWLVLYAICYKKKNQIKVPTSLSLDTYFYSPAFVIREVIYTQGYYFCRNNVMKTWRPVFPAKIWSWYVKGYTKKAKVIIYSESFTWKINSPEKFHVEITVDIPSFGPLLAFLWSHSGLWTQVLKLSIFKDSQVPEMF